MVAVSASGCNRGATADRVDLARDAPARRHALKLTTTWSTAMFFITYLRRELRRRMRQAIFIAMGLALGIGLVVTVTAASAGVRKAQSDVLKSLYGVGTDITITGKAPKPRLPGSGPPKG